MLARAAGGRRRAAALALLLAGVGAWVAAERSGAQATDETAMAGTAPLAGTAWVAADIGGRGVVDRLQSTLRFEDAGRVSGTGGCNHYSGPVEVGDGTLSFGALAASQMACPPAVMNQEDRFFAALSSATRWRLTAEGKLVLADGADAPLVTFDRLRP